MQATTGDSPGGSPATQAFISYGQRHWQLLVAPMLLLLHVAALRGVADGWARALLVAHFGFVLLWQPFLRGQQRISATQASLILFIAGAVTLFVSWWLLAFWVVILAGLVGGKVYRQQARWQRWSYLALFLYLLALLMIVILPEIAPGEEISREVKQLAAWGLPLLVIGACLLPAGPDAEDTAEVVDLFYSVFLMLLLGVIVLGSFTFMTLGKATYLRSMTYTLFAISSTVLALSFTWSTRSGFAGINVFFVRYLLSIGLPLEQWLFFLSELSRQNQAPEGFVKEAVQRLLRLPWVSGVQWRTATGSGEAGQASSGSVRYDRGELELTIHSRFKISPALHWHLQLVAQLLAEFYVAKLREVALEQQSYLRAIHETGARVTHDVKNLLQSLNVLCSVMQRDATAGSAASFGLVRSQLPLLTQRLSATLDRLQRPSEGADAPDDAGTWWRALQLQYAGQGVDFTVSGSPAGILIPRTMFESAAENLLQNALAKRAVERGIEVHVRLECIAGSVCLEVADTGSPVPDELAARLLNAPVPSERGLGIGLYQAAQRASSAGYALRLQRNDAGGVAFVLDRASQAQGSTPAEIRRP